jgi:hypothetical protein
MRAGAAAAAAVLACVAPPLYADEFEVDNGWELGGRTWWSTGKTQWSHNAQGSLPSFGNPTSVLAYDRLNATSIEFFGAKRWHPGWFISGNVGVGRVYGGKLTDTDYNAGQVKASESTSSVDEGTLGYLTFDGGYDFLRGWRSSLGVIAGLNYWNESVDVKGASFSVPAGMAPISSGTKVITNEVNWLSFRLGLAGRLQLGDRFNLSGTVAAVPYSRLNNDDSHYLRTDLGSTPNIKMTANGYGVQMEGEARYTVGKMTDIGLGLRYWKLKATSGDISFGGAPNLPLTDFQSTRYGATFSVARRW